MLRLAASPLPFPRNTSGPAADAAAAAAAAATHFAKAVQAAAVPVDGPPAAGGSAGAAGDDDWYSEVAFPSPEEHLAPLVTTTQAGWMQGAAGMASFLLDYRASMSGNGTAHNGTHPRGPGARVSWPDEPW